MSIRNPLLWGECLDALEGVPSSAVVGDGVIDGVSKLVYHYLRHVLRELVIRNVIPPPPSPSVMNPRVLHSHGAPRVIGGWTKVDVRMRSNNTLRVIGKTGLYCSRRGARGWIAKVPLADGKHEGVSTIRQAGQVGRPPMAYIRANVVANDDLVFPMVVSDQHIRAADSSPIRTKQIRSRTSNFCRIVRGACCGQNCGQADMLSTYSDHFSEQI
jgi:hypothetical protein